MLDAHTYTHTYRQTDIRKQCLPYLSPMPFSHFQQSLQSASCVPYHVKNNHHIPHCTAYVSLLVTKNHHVSKCGYPCFVTNTALVCVRLSSGVCLLTTTFICLLATTIFLSVHLASHAVLQTFTTFFGERLTSDVSLLASTTFVNARLTSCILLLRTSMSGLVTDNHDTLRLMSVAVSCQVTNHNNFSVQFSASA